MTERSDRNTRNSADEDWRSDDFAALVPLPDLVGAGPGFTVPPPLTAATVAIVTTAGLMHRGDDSWGFNDASFREFEVDDDVIVGHVSTNFDRSGVAADRNVVYPVDRLEELAASGRIGAVSRRHLSFMGATSDLATLQLDTGPAAANRLIEAGVDVVLLTPV